MFYRAWVEHSLHKYDRILSNKVDSDELLQVKESLNRKLDITTFLDFKTDLNNINRIIEKDVRDLTQQYRGTSQTSRFV